MIENGRTSHVIIPCNNGSILMCRHRLSEESDGTMWCFGWEILEGRIIRSCE